MMDEIDPFSQVFSALWSLADASDVLGTLVKPGNRIRYDGTDRSPGKQWVSDADLPELNLLTIGSQGVNLHASSNSSQITRIYAWHIATGDVRSNYRLFPVEFAIWSAMANWEVLLTSQCIWRGYRFVKAANIVSVTDRLTKDEYEARKIYGWLAVWQASVMMDFKTQDLIDFNTQGS